MDLQKVISQSSELWFLILDGQPTLTGVLIYMCLLPLLVNQVNLIRHYACYNSRE
jgi:hypothetical protein